MSQLSFFESASQPSPPARSRHAGEASIVPLAKSRSPRRKNTSCQKQPPLQAIIRSIARSPQCPIAPKSEGQPTCPILPDAPAQAAAIASTDRPEFNPVGHCRLCGAPVKRGGLDHSLCSGDCGWVVDLTWLARQERLKRSKEPEPQATTHSTEASNYETLDLFTYGLDRDTLEAEGGVE